MNRKERQEAKAGRYRELAEKAMKESKEAYSQSHKLVENIPMGQPVLYRAPFRKYSSTNSGPLMEYAGKSGKA